MSNVVPLPPSNPTGESAADEQRIEQTRALARTLFESLPRDQQEALLREMMDKVRATTAPGPRAGEVLATVVDLLPKRRTWTAAELKQVVDDRGVSATAKEIYNAIHYLARRGNVSRIGYGRYAVNGMFVATSEDLGGPPGRHEGGPDD